MTTNNHRETARAIAEDLFAPLPPKPASECHLEDPDTYREYWQRDVIARAEFQITTALTNLEAEAYARGLEDAAKIIAELERVECPTANFRMTPLSERVRRVVNELLNARTAAEAERRIRAEIAERVNALPATRIVPNADVALISRDDVLAIIEGGGKP